MQVYLSYDNLLLLKQKSFITSPKVDVIWKRLQQKCEVNVQASKEQVKSLPVDALPKQPQEVLSFIWNSLLTRCPSTLLVSKADLQSLNSQDDEPVLSNEEIQAIWKEMIDICNPVQKVASETIDAQVKEYQIQGNCNTTIQRDLCIAYSMKNGHHVASLIQKNLQGITCSLLVEDNKFVPDHAEEQIASSTAMIVILTEDCLQQPEVFFAIKTGMHYYRELSRIILVHNAEGSFFPVPPPVIADVFSEKAITFLSCYLEEGIKQITEKIQNEKIAHENISKRELTQSLPEDLSTRVFLSHKRSTGQGIAGRLYEGLKGSYKVFIDSEAKFKIHNLKQIVEHTDNFVFILSHGILLSEWCLQELLSAVEHKINIIVIRDLNYRLPSTLPAKWEPVSSILKGDDQLIWMAEYNASCIKALKAKIGLCDSLLAKPKSSPQGQSFDLTKYQFTPDEVESLEINGSNIISLNLASSNIKDTDLHAIAKGCPKVERVNVSDCKVGSAGVRAIGMYCPQLKEINLANCGSITDDAIKKVGEGCKNLTEVDLGECKNITHVGLQVLVQHCTNIVALNLKNCSKVNDEALKMIAQHCHAIQYLSLHYCYEVTDVGIVDVSKDLEYVSLYNISKVTDVAVKSLAEHCPNLQVVILDYCTKVTNIGIKSLETVMNLRQLYTSGCWQITDVVFEELKKKFPKVKIN